MLPVARYIGHISAIYLPMLPAARYIGHISANAGQCFRAHGIGRGCLPRDCGVDTATDGEVTKGGNWGILGASSSTSVRWGLPKR
jgi:hypothetical protein